MHSDAPPSASGAGSMTHAHSRCPSPPTLGSRHRGLHRRTHRVPMGLATSGISLLGRRNPDVALTVAFPDRRSGNHFLREPCIPARVQPIVTGSVRIAPRTNIDDLTWDFANPDPEPARSAVDRCNPRSTQAQVNVCASCTRRTNAVDRHAVPTGLAPQYVATIPQRRRPGPPARARGYHQSCQRRPQRQPPHASLAFGRLPPPPRVSSPTPSKRAAVRSAGSPSTRSRFGPRAFSNRHPRRTTHSGVNEADPRQQDIRRKPVEHTL